MDYKISDSEWKVMEILWEKGAATQSEVMDALTEGQRADTGYNTGDGRIDGPLVIRHETA